MRFRSRLAISDGRSRSCCSGSWSRPRSRTSEGCAADATGDARKVAMRSGVSASLRLVRFRSALHARIPIREQPGWVFVPDPYVQIPNAEHLGAFELLSHDRRGLGARPRGDRHDVLDAIQFVGAIGQLLVHQDLRLLHFQLVVMERLPTPVKSHATVRLALDAMIRRLVACSERLVRFLEAYGCAADAREIAIDRFTEAARRRGSHRLSVATVRVARVCCEHARRETRAQSDRPKFESHRRSPPKGEASDSKRSFQAIL